MAGQILDLTIPKYVLVRDSLSMEDEVRAARLAMVTDGSPTHWIGYLGLPRDGVDFYPREGEGTQVNKVGDEGRLFGYTVYFCRVSNMEVLATFVIGVAEDEGGERYVFVRTKDSSERHIYFLGAAGLLITLRIVSRLWDIHPVREMRVTGDSAAYTFISSYDALRDMEELLEVTVDSVGSLYAA